MVWTKEALEMLYDIIKAFEPTMMDTFDGHRDSHLYTLTNHLLEYMVEDLQFWRRFQFLTAVQMSILICTSSTSIEVLREAEKHG